MVRPVIAFLIFLTVVAVVAMFSGLFGPGEWYADLRKPPWNPPSWVFGPVWSVLYLMMVTAAWQVWERRHRLSHRAIAWWSAQLAMNGAWSWLFFGLHRMDLALVEMALLWVTILATIRIFRRVRPSAAGLMIPYFLWVSFAWMLNFAIWWMNGGKVGLLAG